MSNMIGPPNVNYSKKSTSNVISKMTSSNGVMTSFRPIPYENVNVKILVSEMIVNWTLESWIERELNGLIMNRNGLKWARIGFEIDF